MSYLIPPSYKPWLDDLNQPRAHTRPSIALSNRMEIAIPPGQKLPFGPAEGSNRPVIDTTLPFRPTANTRGSVSPSVQSAKIPSSRPLPPSQNQNLNLLSNNNPSNLSLDKPLPQTPQTSQSPRSNLPLGGTETNLLLPTNSDNNNNSARSPVPNTRRDSERKVHQLMGRDVSVSTTVFVPTSHSSTSPNQFEVADHRSISSVSQCSTLEEGEPPVPEMTGDAVEDENKGLLVPRVKPLDEKEYFPVRSASEPFESLQLFNQIENLGVDLEASTLLTKRKRQGVVSPGIPLDVESAPLPPKSSARGSPQIKKNAHSPDTSEIVKATEGFSHGEFKFQELHREMQCPIENKLEEHIPKTPPTLTVLYSHTPQMSTISTQNVAEESKENEAPAEVKSGKIAVEVPKIPSFFSISSGGDEIGASLNKYKHYNTPATGGFPSIDGLTSPRYPPPSPLRNKIDSSGIPTSLEQLPDKLRRRLSNSMKNWSPIRSSSKSSKDKEKKQVPHPTINTSAPAQIKSSPSPYLHLSPTHSTSTISLRTALSGTDISSHSSLWSNIPSNHPSFSVLNPYSSPSSPNPNHPPIPPKPSPTMKTTRFAIPPLTPSSSSPSSPYPRSKKARVSRSSDPSTPRTPISASLLAGGFHFSPTETLTRTNEHFLDAMTRARQKVGVKTKEERRREDLKKRIVIVGLGDQSPDGRVSEWL